MKYFETDNHKYIIDINDISILHKYEQDDDYSFYDDDDEEDDDLYAEIWFKNDNDNIDISEHDYYELKKILLERKN